MKKTVAIILALVLVFAMSISCFAASYGDVNGDGSIMRFLFFRQAQA